MELLIKFLATFLIIIMVFAALFIFRRKLNYFFLMGFAGYGLAKFIETLIKGVYYIPRPYIYFHKNPLVLFAPKDSSFPSGHTSSAFMLATLVYFYNKRLGIVFYILALLVGVGRVLANVHYPIDIAGGAVLGLGAAVAVNYLMRKIKKMDKLD